MIRKTVMSIFQTGCGVCVCGGGDWGLQGAAVKLRRGGDIFHLRAT